MFMELLPIPFRGSVRERVGARVHRKGREERGCARNAERLKGPPPGLEHGHCLGRHLRITLVVPCVKYRLWSVAVTVCYETDTHAYC